MGISCNTARQRWKSYCKIIKSACIFYFSCYFRNTRNCYRRFFMERTPHLEPNRLSNELERSFYNLSYAVQNLGRSLRGRYDMTNPAIALEDIKVAKQRLIDLERACKTDLARRAKYAASVGLPAPAKPLNTAVNKTPAEASKKKKPHLRSVA